MAIALVRPAEDAPRLYSALWDLGRAAQNMVLAAWELGIGSVLATVYDHDLVGACSGCRTTSAAYHLLSFGHPADPEKLTAPNKPGGRITLEEIVRRGALVALVAATASAGCARSNAAAITSPWSIRLRDPALPPT